MHTGSICTVNIVLGCGVDLNIFLMCFERNLFKSVGLKTELNVFLVKVSPFILRYKLQMLAYSPPYSEGMETSVTDQCFSILPCLCHPFFQLQLPQCSKHCNEVAGSLGSRHDTPSRNTTHFST